MQLSLLFIYDTNLQKKNLNLRLNVKLVNLGGRFLGYHILFMPPLA